ncbi:SDR family NAD(P)-dependent oxidoreductase [Micromonospora sp. NPDC048830]|uniref:SDR family NAD(P)-dependent oxidoreductase n=1 Tax=Micromonospora sp. NPDC048830 TaxID=3364257 RepID=UPI0037187774
MVAAAGAGGGLGVFDLARGDRPTLRALERAAASSAGPIGVRVPAGCAATAADVARAAQDRVSLLVLPADGSWPLREAAERHRVLVEVTSGTEARTAAASGAYGLIARGSEAGGRVGELSSFVLLQQLLADEALDLPVWVAGGIGPRTAAACVVGGAAGVVLDSQLALMPESDLPEDVRAVIGRMDGSETVLRDGVRGVRRDGRPDGAGELLPVGEDGWLAAVFRQRWRGTADAVRGIRAGIADAVGDAAAGGSLAPGAPLARALGVRIPVAQGPMTRVSDVAGFAAAVAGDGALPFIALALAGGEQSRRMLREAVQALGGSPWGVGILGFAPEEVRAAQLAAVREARPPVVIIAGGRPAQAKALEADGINVFLHVPSPGLLRQFLRAGARRFVFEGAECGGHVGPRTSFSLWEAQALALEEFLDGAPPGTDGRSSASAPPGTGGRSSASAPPGGAPDGSKAAAQVQVLFAGGIHDARSAAMVAALAGPLARRGVQVGVLMGTAYLFTREAVECGAIQPLFQRQAIAATGTAVLETAPGHVTRCLHSPYVDDFHRVRHELLAAGVAGRRVWESLEVLNVGRLRIASKGRRREGGELVAVDEAGQHAEGLFMAGQVAVLRDARTTVAALHAGVTTGAQRFHAERVAALAATLGPGGEAAERAPVPPLDVAIVGMACVFPESPDLASFWQTILSGRDAVTEVPAGRWPVDTYYASEVEPRQAGRLSVSKWGGFIAPIPFDAIGYGIPPAALASIDPTQLLALEVARRALLDAGCASGVDHSRTGVVFGAEVGSDMAHAQNLRMMLPTYLGEVPAELEDQLPTVTEDSFPGVLANVITGRVANRLDLGGPNFTVDAACASSLAALDAACKELAAGTSDLMICGGADLHNGINDYLMFSSAHALSPTGRSRAFDSTGDGIALGEGVACVVLKRLAEAERDGDRIYAVIKGVGSSSDGRALGLTAPRAEGQRRALDRAYARSGISPRQVGLIEAHGTGTIVGDRTELETLTRLFVESGAQPGSCALGSVKSQIGHTKCAAGLAGLIKTALALYTGVRPPTINLTRPNPVWDPRRSPFVFYTKARPWSAPAGERIAGLSAFGFGGTNYHVVLAAHAHTPEPRHARQEWSAELFCFRGPDRSAAHRAMRQVAAALQATDAYGRPWRLRDLAATAAAQADLRSGPVQVAIVARGTAELDLLLRRALAGEHDPGQGLIQPPEQPTGSGAAGGKVAFLFPGQGSQYPGALAELFVTFPDLRQYLELGEECADVLFPPAAFDPTTERAQQQRSTRMAQPVLGIGGLAVDHLLRRLNIRPDVAAGHSYGELVALCAAGSYDPSTLLRLSRQRADAIFGATGDDPGTMAAVGSTAERLVQVLAGAGLADQVVLANRNAPTEQVISGPTPAVQAAVTALKAAGLTARRLNVACAFHSPLVAAAVDRFAQALAVQPVTPPDIPVWSNRTAAAYPAAADGVRHELAAQIGAPVRFVEQIEAMYAAGARTFVEAGPGQVLTRLVQAVLADRPHLAIACDRRTGEGLRDFLIAVAQLACAGVPVQTGWLWHGRDTVEATAAAAGSRPFWTVDGQLVRDRDGNRLPGGMTPPRRIKELSMTGTTERTANGRAHRNGRETPDELLAEFLRTNREMIASQRDVMLAYLGNGTSDGPLARPPETHRPASSPVDTAGTAAGPPAPGSPVPAMAAPFGPDYAAPFGHDYAAAPPGVAAGGTKTAVPVSPAPAPTGPRVPGQPATVNPPIPVAPTPVTATPVAPTPVTAPAVTAPAVPPPDTGGAPVAAQAATVVAEPPGIDLRSAVLAVLSERTGYPVDLIDLDLDLEADLSIDSIKRTEVAGEVVARLGLSAEGDESELEELIKARTVRAMLDLLTTRVSDAVTSPVAGDADAAPSAAAGATSAVSTAPADGAASPFQPPAGGPVGAVGAPAPPAAAIPAGTDLPAVVLAVLSERTGYPVDLIDLDLDLEADLSIDSIKRTEVAGEVIARLGLSAEGDESELEELIKARTVRGMLDLLTTRVNGAVAARVPASPPGAPVGPAPAATLPTIPAQPRTAPPAATPTGHQDQEPRAAPAAGGAAPAGGDGRLGVAPTRMLPTLVPVPAAPTRPATVLAGATFAVTGSGAVAGQVVELLRRHGATVRTGTAAEPGAGDGVDGLVLLDGLAGGQAPLLPGAFGLVKRALAGGPRWVFAVAAPSAGADGLGGLFRTIAREYPSTTARLVLVDRTEPAQGLAQQIVDELLLESDATVVHRGDGGRRAYDLVPAGLGALAAGGAGPAGDGVAEARAIGLDRDSVVVLVGGARGITSWFARALATAAGCRIELVGRTPLPQGPPDPVLAAATDAVALRAALAGQGIGSPATIARTAQEILAGREVEATVRELGERGARVRYHNLDVRDAQATRQLITAIHGEYGRIDGLVYAAGVIEDKLIADKDPQSFTRVFDTKVTGAQAVLGALEGLRYPPRFVVLYGSIAATYGSRGQSDYAAANDALEAIGARWRARTGNRCLTVHWGPWAPVEGHGGMVTAELSRAYARRGIRLIDPEDGALSLLGELAWGDPADTAVVYAASGW